MSFISCRFTSAILGILCLLILLWILAPQGPVVAAPQDSPIQVLNANNNYFLKVDLQDSRVRVRVGLANNDTGGFETLSSMKNRYSGKGYVDWAIINGDYFGTDYKCPSNVNCAQGLTYIDGNQKPNWSEYGTTWPVRGSMGLDSSKGIQLSIGHEQSKKHMTISGGPMIVRGGGQPTCNATYDPNANPSGGGTTTFSTGEQFNGDKRSYCSNASNLTMVGYSSDRRYMYMGVSKTGKTVLELAQWLKDQGASDVLKLDSGGSSGMYHNGTMILSTDGRTLPNHLAVIVDNSEPPPPGGSIDLCDGSNYGTPCRNFTWTGDDNSCQSLGDMDNKANSIRFNGEYDRNYDAILYGDTGCGVFNARWDYSVPDFGLQNNNFSSIRIEKHKPPQPPGAPHDPTPANGTQLPAGLTSVKVSFQADGDQFRVHAWGSNYDVWSDWSSSREVQLNNLTGQTYNWQAQAKNNVGESPWSDEWKFTIQRTDTDLPTATFIFPVQGGYINTNQVQIEVSASDQTTSVKEVKFLVGYDDGNSWDWHDVSSDMDGSNGWQATWDASALSDKKLAFWVYVYDQADNRGEASIGEVTLDRTPPSSSVAGLTAQVPTSFTVAWSGSDNLSGIASYDVQYRDGANGTWIDWQTNVTDDWALINGQSGHTYYFRSRAHDKAGNIEDWPLNADTQTFVGLVPASFNKFVPANGTINVPTNPTLSWGASSGATSYEYCIDTSNDNACANNNWVGVGNATSKGLTGLANSTTFYWQVRARNNAGTTDANGGWWSFTTQGVSPSAFNKVSPANGATDQSTSPTLSWGASSGAASYEYCIDTTNDNACANNNWVSVGNVTSKGLTGLTNSTTYYWQVRARNNAGTTDANGGVWWSFTTQGVAPTAKYEDTSPPTTYTGAWTAASASNASGGTYRYSSQTGATGCIILNGYHSFTVYTITGGNRGIANVLVDGSQVAQFDGYGAIVYGVPMGPFPLPDTGQHTICVQVSGVPHTGVTGTVVVLDYILASADTVVPTCYSLNVSANPGAGGSITKNPSPNCNNGTQYTSGTQVTLTANPSANYAFANWSGDASGSTSQVNVTMNSSKTVTANFTIPQACYSLNLSVNPGTGGSITKNPSPDCNNGTQYTSGTQVTLTANPSANYTFANWSGDASGSTSQVNVAMNSNKNITANFNATTSANLLVNGSFEVDANGDGIPDAWGTANYLKRVSKPKYDGSYAMRIRRTDNLNASMGQTVKGLSAGTTYNVSGCVNIPATTDSFTLKAQVKWLNVSNKVISTVTISPTYSNATNGWVCFTKSITAPTNTASAKVILTATSLKSNIFVDLMEFKAQ